MPRLRQRQSGLGYHRTAHLGLRAAATALALLGLGCHDVASPIEGQRPPFTGERYDLVALDGKQLPGQFESFGEPFLVDAATVTFVSDDSVDFRLVQVTPLTPGTPPTDLGVWRDQYEQPARDSIEIGAVDFDVFRVSPWAYGRRTADTLIWRTADPAPSDPRIPDIEGPPFGLHVWRFVRHR